MQSLGPSHGQGQRRAPSLNQMMWNYVQLLGRVHCKGLTWFGKMKSWWHQFHNSQRG